MTNFTRSAVIDRIPISKPDFDYWLNLGIVRNLPGPGGRGVPRRFGSEDVMIAGIMHELHSYGVRSELMRGVADMLYPAVETGRAMMPLIAVDIFPHLLGAVLQRGDGITETPSNPDTMPGIDEALAHISPDSSLVIAEALNTYHLLFNPQYLDTRPPYVVMEFTPGAESFDVNIRDETDPSMLLDPDVTSCIAVSLTKIARRLWLPDDAAHRQS